jgi:rare lipoprotein A
MKFKRRRSYGGASVIAIGVGLTLFAAGCVTQTAAPPQPVLGTTAAPSAPIPPPVVKRSKRSNMVRASYQGSDTAGDTTASGEAYNPNALTAASRNLPMGSIVRVTNPATGRSVKVRINDRGPFVHGRSLDLSQGAAEKLGIIDKGVARLKVTRVRSASGASEADASPPPASAPHEPQAN